MSLISPRQFLSSLLAGGALGALLMFLFLQVGAARMPSWGEWFGGAWSGAALMIAVMMIRNARPSARSETEA